MPGFDRPASDSPSSVMALWDRYQRCLVARDPEELLSVIDHLERAKFAGSEPPAWMRSWGSHVSSQPLRTAVDPAALGAACALRAASVMAEADRPAEAQTLYRHVLTRYSGRDWSYFVEQAKAGLDGLPASPQTVIALRPASASSR